MSSEADGPDVVVGVELEIGANPARRSIARERSCARASCAVAWPNPSERISARVLTTTASDRSVSVSALDAGAVDVMPQADEGELRRLLRGRLERADREEVVCDGVEKHAVTLAQ